MYLLSSFFNNFCNYINLDQNGIADTIENELRQQIIYRCERIRNLAQNYLPTNEDSRLPPSVGYLIKRLNHDPVDRGKYLIKWLDTLDDVINHLNQKTVSITKEQQSLLSQINFDSINRVSLREGFGARTIARLFSSTQVPREAYYDCYIKMKFIFVYIVPKYVIGVNTAFEQLHLSDRDAEEMLFYCKEKKMIFVESQQIGISDKDKIISELKNLYQTNPIDTALSNLLELVYVYSLHGRFEMKKLPKDNNLYSISNPIEDTDLSLDYDFQAKAYIDACFPLLHQRIIPDKNTYGMLLSEVISEAGTHTQKYCQLCGILEIDYAASYFSDVIIYQLHQHKQIHSIIHSFLSDVEMRYQVEV